MAENPQSPLLDRSALEEQFGGYEPPETPGPLPNVPFRGLDTPTPPSMGGDGEPVSALKALDASVKSPAGSQKRGGSIPRAIGELTNPRFNVFVPGDYNNEDAYARGQHWTEKMVNGVGKGLVLTGTTFLQGTVGLVNGVGNWIATGNFSSFYDNEMNRGLDDLNKYLDNNVLPNYETNEEKNAAWYSPDNLFTGNFLWNGIVKNLGFAAGAALSGGVYAAGIKALSALPGISRLVSIGKQAEVIAATEAGLAGANKVADTYGKIKSLSDRLLTSYQTLTPGGRAVVAGLATTGEAGFEALQNLNEKRNELVQQYVDENSGVYPTGEALERINREAEKVGNSSFFANVALLTATNYIQFPKILGSSYSAEKGLINSLRRETKDIIEESNKYIQKPFKGGKILGTLNKIRPYTFSVSEAFEEGAQFAIGVSTKDYYDKKNNNEPTSFLNSLAQGISQTFGTDEGMENLLIGGLSGSIMQARGRFSDDRQKAKNTADAIQKFNKFRLSDFTKDTIDSVNRGTVLQQEREELLKRGDILNSKDKEADYIINYLSPRIKYGRYDLVQAEINDYKMLASSDEGFAQLVAEGKALSTDTREAYVARLQSLEQVANGVKSLYQSLNLRYGGAVDEQGKPLYSPAVIDKMVYAASKVADYDVRIPKLTPKLVAAGINIDDVVRDIIDGKTDSFNEAVDMIKNMKTLTDDQKADLGEALEDIAEMSIRRDNFLQEYNEMKKSPKKFEEYEPTIEDDEQSTSAEVEKIKVKTKSGEKELDTNTEYFVGKGFDYDKDGLEVPIPISSLTILGENEDGTIKIKDNKGEVRDVSKDVLENYLLEKKSDLRANKTASYFFRHRNEIFEYNFGKNYGGRKTGRLEYEKGKLFFVYKDDKGKIRRKQIDNTHFIAQEGFDQARIKKVGEVENDDQKVAREEFTSAEEIAKQKETLANNKDARLEIVAQIENETRSRLEEVNKKLETKKKDLETIQKDLKEIGDEVRVSEPRTKREKALEAKYPELSRQKAKFSKVMSTTSKALTKLSRMRQSVEDEIAALTSEKNELELNLSYFEDFTQNLDKLPENSGEFFNELKEQVQWLKMLIEETGQSINTLSKMAKSIDQAIKDFTDFLKDSLQKFNKDYPDYIKDKIAEIQENTLVIKNFADLRDYMAEIALLEDVQKEISINENKLEDVDNQIAKLYQEVNELGAEYNAKKQILDRFQVIADAYAKRKTEEEAIMKNEKLKSEALGTADQSVQTVEFSKEYEASAKKATEIIPRATSGVMKGKAHQVRANNFGFNLNKFENRGRIRGVYVTSKNEKELKLVSADGKETLTDRLRVDEQGQINEDIKKDEIIAVVMVEEDADGNITLVGEDGKPLPEGTNPLDGAIFQVFPDGDLRWGAEFNNESMFRKDTPQEVIDAVTKQYKEWRQSVLDNPNLAERHEIEASFGTVQNVTDADGKIIYETRTSVEDADLATADDLESTQLITIPTTNTTVSKGTVSFNSPLGRVFLETPNGLVKLQNRQHTRKEAEAIYQAILQFAKNMLDPKIGVNGDPSKRLLTWLKSVTYWGIPTDQQNNRKPAGYNSVFFEKDEETGKLMLTLSGKGKDFVFTPTALEDNKESILILLSGMYNNINSHMAKQLNEPYEEILSVSEDGKINSRLWKNYQSFLLSKTTPDGKSRSGEQLPLSTTMKPITATDEVNRTNIYFYTTDTADNFVIPVVEKKAVVTPKVLTPGGPTPQVAPQVTPPVAPVSTDAKADIETRRQEELRQNLSKTDFATSLFPAFAQSNMSQGGGAYMEVNFGKNNIFRLDTYLTPSAINGQYPSITDGKAQLYGEMSDGTKISLPWNQLKDLLNSIKAVNTKGEVVYEFDKNKINAKYDAELAALEGAKPTTKYTLDGKTQNTYTSPEGKKIMFVAPATTTAENFATEVKILKGGDLDEVVAKIKAAGKDPGEVLKKTVFNAISGQLAELQAIEQEVVFIGGPATEEVVTVAEQQMGKPVSQSVLDAINTKISGLNNEALRLVIKNQLKSFKPENWNDVEKWLKAKFPNVPVYRVKNIIQATNGRQAWGMFKDGAIYIYENAEVGTVYHEVFHAVWRMFASPAEQLEVMAEMRSRKGTFFDRASLKDVSYSEATEEQLEEKLAEEFRDYVQAKKTSKEKSKIARMFSDMVKAIKELFLGEDSESKVEEMFRKIDEGDYNAHIPFATNLSYAKQGIIDIEDAYADSNAVFSLFGITDRERNDIIQHMTYLTLTDLITTDKSLFEIPNLNKKELYDRLKTQIQQTIAQKIQVAQSLVTEGIHTQEEVNPIILQTVQLMQNVEDQWDMIIDRHQEYLKGYAIEFDENDQINLRDENNSGREFYQDATKIDSFKKANSAVKLLLATVPDVNQDGTIKPSSIGGAVLLPISKTYVSLMNNLYTSASIEEMIDRLRTMAENDPNYRTLYKRITKRPWSDKGVDLSQIDTEHGSRLLSSIWRTFKKQNPDVKNVFILENGDVVVGEANLASAAQQLKNEYISAIVFKARSGEGFFTYDEKERVFKGDPKKAKEFKLDNYTAMVSFLNTLGIPFTVSEINKMNNSQQKQFKEVVAGIKESITKAEKIATFSGKALDIDKRLFTLGLLKAAVENPEFSSTYFNVSGERTQSFIGTNAASDFSEFFSKLSKFNKESIGGTRYSYLLTDSFVKGSNLLSRTFTTSGTRKDGTEDLFKIGYVGGIVNEQKGKRKESSKLTYKDRLVQELNLNLSGWYLNLVPGDASIEWMIKLGNAISMSSLSRGMTDINEIFKGYFLSELELAKEENRSVAKGRNANEMRFFRDILGKELHDSIIADPATPDVVYERFANRINAKLEDFIRKDMEKLKAVLSQYGIIKTNEFGTSFENVNIPENLSENALNSHLMMLSVNYMVANIEMHKLLYSDPYQYEDELKRIKSFSSPRQAIISGSPKMNSVFNKIWNKGFKAGSIGITKFTQDYFRSATHADVIGVIDLPGYQDFKETDGSGIITMKANRHFRIRAGEWNSDEERQYRHDVAYEELIRSGATEEEIDKFEKNNPGIQSAYTPLKPIVSGTKLGKDGLPESYNNVVLDKFALYPLSYRILRKMNKSSNAINLYEKMQREDIDYVVFASSRKVGAENPHATYNQDGSFNDTPYSKDTVINVPFSIMSIQSEVPSKGDNTVTRGSQITKLITLDFMEAGVPVDFFSGQPFTNRYNAWYKLTDEEKAQKSPLYKEIKNNQDLLEALIEQGYRNTLDKLGITETITKEGKKYEITDFSKAVKTLRDEILKREVNDNISDALNGFLDGRTILEATPAYQQVRNIIYSIADKQFISPKINGGLKVQIPSTLMEKNRVAITEINGKKGYESDVLKFYEKDGKRVAEVMLARWFDSPLSDEELLKYLNTTDEGQKILAGIGFRIPTQKQNSVDAIVIAKFLPKEFGDSVVIPAALVQKVGSDFDIDKLSVYLKNVYIKNGKPKLIPYFGTGQQAIDKITELFDKGEFLSDEEIKELDRYIAEETLTAQDFMENTTNEAKLLRKVMGVGNLFSQEEMIEEFTRGIRSREQIINRLYKKSLENEYIQSMENLVQHPSNYQNLIKPNSVEDLKELGAFIAEKTVGQSFDYKNVSNMLDRTFMSRLRHAFVTGKYAIGIAAVNQTNHSLNQRQPVYIDKTRMNLLSDEDRFWIGNGDVKFSSFNRIEVGGRMVPTLSMITNAVKENISDILGMFIDGYVDISRGPWIMELGATPNVASTWMFLVKLGVPIKTVAYFMNQPIIRDYLRTIESAGYSWLFIDQFVEDMSDIYGQDMTEAELEKKLESFTIPGETALKNNVGKKVSELTPDQRMEQYLMLKEFLKYAKMAEQLFHVTQGSNFDTATFNDPYLVFKKLMQHIKAQNTIINSVDNILSNSFIGKLASSINSIRDAFAEILKSDQPKIRSVIQKVLTPYVDMNDRDFVKLAQKAVNDLFDWAVQNDQKLNEMIQDILITDGGVGKEVMTFVNSVKKDRSHPLYNNQVINILESIPSRKAGEGNVNNVKIAMGDTRVYDQNNVIYAFRELREYLKGKNNPLYERIKLMAILQSGLSSSPISFTSLLPHEDFKEVYIKTLSKIESIPNLDDFYKLGVFQRNNWNNDDIVPYTAARWIKSKTKRWHYNPAMKFLPDSVKLAVANGEIPAIMTISMRNREANADRIVFTWEKQDELLTPDDIAKGVTAKQKKAQMRKMGDFSYKNKGLFEKVYDDFGKPYVTTDYQGKEYFVYKAINAWGDSFRANEFWATDHKSVIDNGFIQVEDVNNNLIINKFAEKEVKKAASAQQTTPKGTMKLRDGVTYGFSAIKANMLLEMGYTQQEAGKILQETQYKEC